MACVIDPWGFYFKTPDETTESQNVGYLSMIIGTKRKEEVINSRQWIKSVLLTHTHPSSPLPRHHLWMFTSKTKARAACKLLLKTKRTHKCTWQIYIDETGHQLISQVLAYWQQPPTSAVFPPLNCAHTPRDQAHPHLETVYWSEGAGGTLMNFGWWSPNERKQNT